MATELYVFQLRGFSCRSIAVCPHLWTTPFAGNNKDCDNIGETPLFTRSLAASSFVLNNNNLASQYEISGHHNAYPRWSVNIERLNYGKKYNTNKGSITKIRNEQFNHSLPSQ